MKSVLITGANKSIGLETAKQLSKKGLFVYLGSRDTLTKGDAPTGRFFSNDIQDKSEESPWQEEGGFIGDSGLIASFSQPGSNALK